MSKREVFGKYLVYIVFITWLSLEILLSSTLEYIFYWEAPAVNDVMAVSVLVLLSIQIVLLQRYNLKEIAIVLLMTLFIAYATVQSGHKTMMSTWIFIVATKNIDFDKLMKLAYYAQIIFTCVVIYLFLIGYIKEITLYRDSILRHSLGFSHPNQLGVRIFQLIVCRCYNRRKNISFYDAIICALSAYFIHVVCDSKTAYYMLILLTLMLIIHIIIKMTSGKFDKVISYTIIVSVLANLISIILSFINVRQYRYLNMIDKFISRRFSHCHRTLRYYGLSLWGKDIQMTVKRHIVGGIYHFWLDNAYMAILLRYGIVVFIAFSMLYIIALVYAKKHGQYMLAIILCLYSIYGIMENNFFYMSQNIFLLALAMPIYGKGLEEEKLIPSYIRITL